MFSKSEYKKIKTKDGFTDFKHHVSSWRNSKKLRQKNRRKKMKLTKDELEKLYVEMLETQYMNSETEQYARTCEHEDAGDRV